MILPSQLLNDLKLVPGFDEQEFVVAHGLPPATSVRLNPAKDIGLFAPDERVSWCSYGRYLNKRPVFTLDPAFHAGAYYVQEASSMFLDYLLRQFLKGKRGLRVLDLCAAPGGKSTLIASLLDAESLLISNDVIRTRAAILEENMTRWGYMNTWVTSNDPRDFRRLPGYFDVVVVDAPCSGSGLFRKDPKALDEWSEANVQLCSERQQRILADVWPSLKENGLLVYATCSYSPQEDEQMLDWLAGNYQIRSLPVDVQAEWGIATVASPTNGVAGYRFSPDRVRGEGFFIAAMQKTEAADAMRPQRFKAYYDKKAQQMAATLLDGRDALILQTDKENFGAIRSAHEQDFHTLQQSLYLRKVGTQLGMPAGKNWIPAHEAALSIHASEKTPFVDLSREQALRFLKREDMGAPDLPRGWQVVRYQGLGLGWVKSLGNRVNNYLPKHWRIRMDIHDDGSE